MNSVPEVFNITSNLPVHVQIGTIVAMLNYSEICGSVMYIILGRISRTSFLNYALKSGASNSFFSDKFSASTFFSTVQWPPVPKG